MISPTVSPLYNRQLSEGTGTVVHLGIRPNSPPTLPIHEPSPDDRFGTQIVPINLYFEHKSFNKNDTNNHRTPENVKRNTWGSSALLPATCTLPRLPRIRVAGRLGFPGVGMWRATTKGTRNGHLCVLLIYLCRWLGLVWEHVATSYA